MHYLLTHRGPLRLSLNQCGGFLRSRDGLDRPDQQRYLNPVTYTTAPADKRPMAAEIPEREHKFLAWPTLPKTQHCQVQERR